MCLSSLKIYKSKRPLKLMEGVCYLCLLLCGHMGMCRYIQACSGLRLLCSDFVHSSPGNKVSYFDRGLSNSICPTCSETYSSYLPSKWFPHWAISHRAAVNFYLCYTELIDCILILYITNLYSLQILLRGERGDLFSIIFFLFNNIGYKIR